MKNLRFILPFVFFTRCTDGVDPDSQHAYLVIQECNGQLYSEQNKQTVLAKIDSIFFSESSLTPILRKLNEPDHQNASEIRKSIRLEQYRSGTINVSLYMADKDFSIKLLDSLFTIRIEELKKAEKQKMKAEHEKMQQETVSFRKRVKELMISYEKETDPDKKKKIEEELRIAEEAAKNQLEEEILEVGAIPCGAYYILSNAALTSKKL